MFHNGSVTGPEDVQHLPVPEDDGAADKLPGRPLPRLALPATDGRSVGLRELRTRTVVFVYPSIGAPGGLDLLGEWSAVPGARGCTPEACAFRDEIAAFHASGTEVLGLSSQSSARQRDAVEELNLSYPLVSDEAMVLAGALELPTFEFHGVRYFKRLTLVIADAAVETALYPVFPPDEAAEQALRWLNEHPRAA